MEKHFISGIQQIGVGTENMEKSWKWYIEAFGINVKILEDDTVAERMLPYTGNAPQKRHACIAINLQGGGGFEIWQYSQRKPQPINFDIAVGDLGIFAAKLKCRDVNRFHEAVQSYCSQVGPLTKMPNGTACFYLKDPFGNYFQAVEDKSIFIEQNCLTGGMVGAMVGVSDIERALTVYRDILGYDTVVYDQTGTFDDLHFMNGGNEHYRRVLLTHKQDRTGAFAPMFGRSTIELVVALDRPARKIYEGRYWGDPGFIQICFDVTDMDSLGQFCASKGFPFTVDSCANQSHFDMGDASGHFTYIEDPDGTLIEFVETHKIPIVKKLGWNIDLLKRNRQKSLPKFLFRLMGLVSKQKASNLKG